jgi:phenylpropionate dioxygenase-like ring-hydroxylating dioxygenase large terminal subunit
MNVPNGQAYEPMGEDYYGMQDISYGWVGDWLFAGGDCDKFEDAIGGFRQFLIDTSAMIGGRHDFGEMRINCIWQTAVENALEDMHIPLVHPDTFGPLKMHRIAQYRLQNNSMAVYELGDERTVKTITKVGKYLEFDTGPRYFHLFLNPHAAISSVGGITYSVQHYLPQADGSTLFLTRLYRGKTKPGAPDLSAFYDAAADFNARVFKQDADLVETVVGKGYALASPDEDRVAWFREATLELAR